MAQHTQVVIIGGGPGGYNCAIRCAQLGLSTALVEKDELGGTCLNVGCIPSKALLHSSQQYVQARTELPANGVITSQVSLDLPAMMARKNDAVTGLRDGVVYLMKKHGIAVHHGRGVLDGPGRVAVTTGREGKRLDLTADHIIIATGSSPASLEGIEIDEERIVTNTGALRLKKCPRRMVLIGAGVIGLEMGSVWSRLGASVIVTDFVDGILPGADRSVATQAQRILSRQGVEFRLGRKVTDIHKLKTTLKVTSEPAKGGPAETLNADIVVVAVGRVPHTEGLGLASVGASLDARGCVVTDGAFRVSDGLWAIGDCISGPMLAHKAEEDGVAVAELIATGHGDVDYDLVPCVVYTHPEIAWIGKTEDQLKQDKIAYRSGRFPLKANSRARTSHQTDGMVKLLAEAGSDRLVGAHIIAAGAGEMISAISVGMEFGASAEDIARTVFPHPTVSEAIRQAALNVDERATQM